MGIVSKELAEAMRVHRVRTKKYLQQSTSVLTPVRALEPRVMLDATLNLDPGVSGFIDNAGSEAELGIEALVGMVETLNAQKDELLDGLTEKFREALEPISGLIDLDGFDFNAFDQGSNSEDQDGDGNFDVDEDANGNGLLDGAEDVDGDGHLDVDEDANNNGKLDEGEDLDGDGWLDVAEDLNGNSVLDYGEDLDRDGKLDVSEDLNGDGDFDTGLSAVTDSQAYQMLSNVYDTISSITDALGVNLESEVSNLKDDIRDRINDFFNEQVGDPTPLLGSVQVTGDPEWLTEQDVETLFRIENLLSLDVLQQSLTDLVNSKLSNSVAHWQELFNGAAEVLSTDVSVYFEALTDGLVQSIAAEATTGITSLLTLNLEDVADPLDGANTLIAFTQGDDDRNVEVSVDMSSLGVAIQDLLAQFEGALDFTGIDISDFDMPDLGLDFEITTEDRYSGPLGSPVFGLDVTVDNFDLKVDGASASEIVFGGLIYDVDTAANPLSVSMGILEAELTTVTTAEFKLDFGNFNTVSAALGFDTSSATIDATIDISGLAPETLIKEVGAADFVAILDYDSGNPDDTTYDMLEVAYSGSVGFNDDLDDASENLLNFEGTFTASALAKTASVDTFLTDLVESFDVTADIDPDTGNAQLDTELKELFVNLASMGMDEIFAMFDGIGTQLDNLLSSDFFDFELPFLDVGLDDAFDFVDNLKSEFMDFFAFDLSDLGLSIGKLSVGGFGITTSGILPTGSLFGDFPEVDLSFTLGTNTYDINLSVPAGGWPDLGSFLAALNAQVSALNLFVDDQGAIANGGLPAISFGWDEVLNTWSIFNASELDLEWSFPDLFNKSFGFADIAVSNPFAGMSFSGSGTTFFDSMKFGSGPVFDGLFDLNFDLGFNGVTKTVKVSSSESAGGWLDLDSFLSDLNLALGDFNLEGINMGDGSFRLQMIDTTGLEVTFGVAADLAYAALSIDGVKDFVNSKIADLIPGSKMVLTEEGELLLSLPELSFTKALTDISNSPDALNGVSFSAEDFGIDWLTDFSLVADVEGVIEGQAAAVISFDIMGYLGSKFSGNGLSERVLELTNNDVPEPSDDASSLGDYIGFAELSAEGRVFAAADNISGKANLGFVEANFGDLDESGLAENGLYFDTQIDFGLSGFDEDSGEYGGTVTYNDIKDALAAGTLSDLIGRFELLGGVEVDEDGTVQLDGSGEFVALSAKDYAGSETLAFFALNIAEIAILVDGLSDSLTENAIDAFNYAGTSLTSLEDNILYLDSTFADAITGLKGDDILDTLTNFASMLVELGDALKEDMPWLDTSIPLLNFSILDGVDFAADFLEALQELRDNPAGAIHNLEGVLLDALGLDQDPANPILYLDAANDTLYLDLVFNFLEDYQEDFNFGFDLDQILGDGNAWSSLLGSLVDVSSSGGIIFDPDISFGIRLGLDMSEVAVNPVLALDTPLAALNTVAAIAMATNGGNELKITRKNTTDPAAPADVVEVDMEGVTTIEEAQDAINAALGAEIDTASFEWDDVAKQFVINDSATTVLLTEGVDSLFGGPTAATDTQITVSNPDDPGNDHDIDSKTVTGTADLTALDFAAEYQFYIVINEDIVETVKVEADASRDSLEKLIEALNAAIESIRLSRSEVFDGLPGTTVSLGNLIDASEDGGSLVLTTTNYMEINGLDLIDLEVRGVDVSDEFTYSFEDLSGANFSELLGFESGKAMEGESYEGESLETSTNFSAPRAFLDTEESGFRVDLNAGVEEGLNVSLAIGPIGAKIVDGKALLTNNSGDGPAFLKFGFADLDGDAHDDEYDLSHLPTLIKGSGAHGLEDFFSFDAEAMIDIDLPFEAVGLLDPSQDGISGQINLLDLNPSDLPDMPTLAQVKDLVASQLQFDFDPSSLLIDLPDLGEIFSNFNIFALLNDPRTVLEGLDYILAMVQDTIDDNLGGLDLPIVGDMVASTVTVFEDLRYGVIEPALDYVSTPDENGALPTTVDVLNEFLNKYIAEFMEEAFGYTQADDFVFAEMVTQGPTNDTYIFATLQFAGKLFETSVDIDFDIGIPGLNLELEEGTALDVEGNFDVHLAFGIDKDGFFFINDNELEVDFSLDLTSDAFEGSFQLGPGLLSAVATDSDNDGISGLGIFATAGLDLFTDLGTDVADIAKFAAGMVAGSAGTGVGLDYSDAKIVRFSEIKGDQLVDFEFKGDFEVDLQLTAEIVNPATGNPITISNPFGDGDINLIPKVRADLIFDGTIDAFGDEVFTVDTAGLMDLSLDTGSLYDDLVKPIMDVLDPFIAPIKALYEIVDSNVITRTAFGFAAQAFPILKVIPAIDLILDIFEGYENSPDSWMNLGDLSLESWFGGGVSAASMEDAAASFLQDGAASLDAALESAISIESDIPPVFSFPILTDPMNALGILLGNYEDVNLVEFNLALINFDFALDTDDLISSLGLPGWVADRISSAIRIVFDAEAYVGIKGGFDMSGIMGFVNTMDPLRLFDGFYIDTTQDLIEFSIDLIVELSINLFLFEAGINLSSNVYFNLGLNDPNEDGKLRIQEIGQIFEAYIGHEESNIGQLLIKTYDKATDSGIPLVPDFADLPDLISLFNLLFEGGGGFNIKLGAYAQLNGWAPFVGKFKIVGWSDDDLISLGYDFTFGQDIPVNYVQDSTAEVAVLNIGAMFQDSLEADAQDVSDTLVLDGPNSPITGTLSTSSGKNAEFEIREDAKSIVAHFGEGENKLDARNMKNRVGGSAHASIISSFGDEDDVINLPEISTGFALIFAGDGDDIITGGDGDYYIFAGEGNDTITLGNGDNLIFSANSHGIETALKDWVSQMTEAGTEITKDAVDTFLQTTAIAFGLEFDDFERQYTKLTQDKASDDEDVIIVGTGSNTIFAGKGMDTITVGLDDNLGNNKIYAGDGDDVLNIGGLTTFVEAGGGADTVFMGDGTNEVYGWGKEFQNQTKDVINPADGEWHVPNTESVSDRGDYGYDDGEVNDANNTSANGYNDDLTKVARADGADLIVGGAGVDTIFGHYGDDLIEGGLGHDYINGGHDDDIVTGGVFEIVDNTGAALVLADETVATVRDSSLIVETDVLADDGIDELVGAQGDDVLFGGSNSDTLKGGLGRDVLIGDYSALHMSSNQVAERVTAKDMDAVGQADDILNGGGDSDLIIGGGGAETISDARGDNIIVGDFATTEGADLSSSISKVTSVASSEGEGDTVNAGIGADIIFGNEGDDHLNGGHGANFIAGDMAELDFATSAIDGFTGSSRLSGILPDISGDDIIVSGLEADIIVAGGGADYVNASVESFDASGFVGASATFNAQDLTPATFAPVDPGTDRNAVLGDNGFIVFDGLARKDAKTVPIDKIQEDLDLTLSIENTVREVTGTMDATNDGDDVVALGKGVDMVVLSGGGDEVTLGLAERYPLGPNGLETTEPAQNYALGDGGSIKVVLDDDDTTTDISNAATKTVTLSTGADKTGGDDTITGDADNDLVIAGAGNDTVDVGEGDAGVSGLATNVVLGDSGEIVFDYLHDIGPILSKAESQRETTDGNDKVTSGTGDDALILGGGNDEATDLGGNNFVAGDGALLDRVAGTFGSSTDTTGGDDVITTGAGRDLILGGALNDIIDVNEGNNTVLSDSGQIVFDPLDLAPVTLTSAADANDGDDEVSALSGDDAFILGGGGDTLSAGDGDNRVLGDSGYIQTLHSDGLGEMATTEPGIGGNDVIATGQGNDLIVGGMNDDVITTEGGRNVIHADGATFRFITDPYKNDLRSITSVGPAFGGNDTITTGAGDDVVLGGSGNDELTTNDGEDIAVGDWAEIQFDTTTTGDHVLTSTDVSNFGDDTIDTGSGNDIAVGGDGNDEISVGSGEDLGVGDDTQVGFTNNTDVEAIELVNNENGGQDTIVATGAGDNILIGNAGADFIQGADDDDMIVGESAQWSFIDFDDRTPDQSAQDRIASAAANDTSLAYSDVLNGGDGRDIIGGGFGSDLIDGEGGDDFLFGDGFQYTNNQDGLTDAEDGTSRFETNFPFEAGGDDILTGGTGNDVMFGGLGADGFHGDTEEDFIFGDSGSTDTLDWKILTVNYPGANPAGVISGSQLGASVGLSLTLQEAGLSKDIFDILQGAPTASGALGSFESEVSNYEIADSVQFFLNAFVTYVSSSEFLETIYQVILATPPEALDVEAILAQFRLDLYRYLLASKQEDLTPIDMLVIDQIVETRLRAVIETVIESATKTDKETSEAEDDLQASLIRDVELGMGAFAAELEEAASKLGDVKIT